MASLDKVALWKAPQPGRDAAREICDGFDPKDYPGNGPYFTTVRTIAEEYLKVYQAGMQLVHLPRLSFDELTRKGVIVPDPFYPDGESYHVPPAGLVLFNAAMQQGDPNQFQS
jgi:hypothetical protein